MGKRIRREDIYLKKLRKMSGEEKILIASELYDLVLEIAQAGIKNKNPHFSKKQVKQELEKRLH